MLIFFRLGVVFFFLYQVSFVFLEFPISLFYGLFSFFVYIVFKRKLIVDKSFVLIGLSFIPLAIWSICCVMFNGNGETVGISWVKNSFLNILISLGVVLLVGKRLSFKRLSFIIVVAVMLQCIIAVTNFIFPAWGDFLYNIQFHNETEEGMYLSTIEHRLTGLGASFFYAGIINGMALIFIGYLLSSYRFPWSQTFLFTLIFVSIAVLGTLMARTTLTGLLVSLLFFAFSFRKRFVLLNFVKFLAGLVILGIGVIAMLYYFPEIYENFSSVIEWGFEFLFNMNQGSGLETASTNQLKEMYILPTQLKTYLVGDGLYADPNDSTLYYMETDVGYLRLLFYIGIPGIFLYFLPQFVIFALIKKNVEDNRIILLSQFLILFGILLNFKGLYDIAPILLLIFFWTYFNKQTSSQYEIFVDSRNP